MILLTTCVLGVIAYLVWHHTASDDFSTSTTVSNRTLKYYRREETRNTFHGVGWAWDQLRDRWKS